MHFANQVLRKLVLASLGILIALLVFEFGVRAFSPQDLDFYNGEKIMRPSPRPGQGVEFIPNSANESYIGVPVRINSLGLRDHEVAMPKPEGVFRVLAVGDSVTFGFGVRLEETYVKRLETRLSALLNGSNKRAEVINAGIEGTGLDYYFEFLKAMGARLEPDLVLVGIVLNDIAVYDERHPELNSRGWRVSTAIGKLNRLMRVHSHLYAYTYRDVKSILYRTGLLDINKTYGGSFLTLGAPSERQARAWSSSLSLLDRLVELARGQRVPLVLVAFPMEVQINAQAVDLYRRTLGVRLEDTALSGAPQRRLAAFARARDVPLIDLLPRFRESGNGALFLRNQVISHDWAHPSREGYDVAADEIFRALRHLGLVPADNKEYGSSSLIGPRGSWVDSAP